MRKHAGISAEGAFPKAAIPAGRLSTPAPTMLLMRFTIDAVMEALPPGFCVAFSSSDGKSAAAVEPRYTFCLDFGGTKPIAGFENTMSFLVVDGPIAKEVMDLPC
jgi:hypothetical protein